jgi:hypothetical protein
MTRFHGLLDHLPGRRRPPTGPLTTDEARRAEALQQETLRDDGRIEQGPEEDSDQQST